MKIKHLLSILAISLISLSSYTQDEVPVWQKLRYLSEEEMNTPLKHPQAFEETDPPVGPIRNVAEFDQMQAIIVRYPFGVPFSLIKEIAEDLELVTIVANESQQTSVLTQYENNGVNVDNCSFLIAPSDSYWVRDYGPWFVFDGNGQPGVMNFPYNRPRPNDNDIPIRVAEMLDIDLYGMNLIHTGGNYMTDGLGISSSTDLIWEENEDLTVEDIDSIVMRYLAVEQYDVRPDPLDDYIKHIDTWGKFLTPGKVLIGQVPESDYRYQDFEDAASFFASTISGYGKTYEVFRVYTPGGSPATPYTNSLIVNNKVFVPLSGNQHDTAALMTYEEALPGYEIIGIPYNGWLNTDALHCRAKGIADLGMLYIHHMPILGTVVHENSYELTAEIEALSGEELYADSVLVYYRFGDGDYMHTSMTYVSEDTWTATIENVDPGTHVDYYIYTADKSGRHMMHPYIGEPDPHEFYAFGLQTDILELNPDTLMYTTSDDALEGKDLYIINVAANPIDVDYISPESNGNPIYWWVEEMPNLPYTIQPDDTLTIKVMVGLTTAQREEYLYDTIFVTSLDDEYHAIIAVNTELVGEIEQKTLAGLEVYPNPFQSQLSFDFYLNTAEIVDLALYDQQGRMVYRKSSPLSSGKQTISFNRNELELKPGLYIYRLQTGAEAMTGKVVVE